MKKANPWLALGLSVLMPGLGQLYAGRRVRAAGWLLGWLGAWGNCLAWIFSESRVDPIAGAVWYALLFLISMGSWLDAYWVARGPYAHRWRRSWGPGRAVAFSLLFPGLGHLLLFLRGFSPKGLLGLPLGAAALLVFVGGTVESPPLPGWPRWLTAWSPWSAALAGAAISGWAVCSAYVLAYRVAGAGHAPLLPRFTRSLWVLAVLAWLGGQIPWAGLLKSRIRSFWIPSSSMEPTLMVGDRILSKRAKDFRRGEIVVFRLADQPCGEYMVKRVAARPGERVTLRDGRLFIDGRAVPEPFLPNRKINGETFGPIVVPANSYFLLGDNRPVSRDSRYFGTVPRECFFGRAYKRYWPLSRAGALSPPRD